jgi:hypothetical protein
MVNPPSSRSGNIEFGGLRRGRAASEATGGRQTCDPIKGSRVHNTKHNTSRGQPSTSEKTDDDICLGSNFPVGHHERGAGVEPSAFRQELRSIPVDGGAKQFRYDGLDEGRICPAASHDAAAPPPPPSPIEPWIDARHAEACRQLSIMSPKFRCKYYVPEIPMSPKFRNSNSEIPRNSRPHFVVDHLRTVPDFNPMAGAALPQLIGLDARECVCRQIDDCERSHMILWIEKIAPILGHPLTIVAPLHPDRRHGQHPAHGVARL